MILASLKKNYNLELIHENRYLHQLLVFGETCYEKVVWFATSSGWFRRRG
jgi:hypothetical protein